MVITVVTAMTQALVTVRRVHVPFLVLGALASAVASGGALSVALLAVGVVLLMSLVGGAIFGSRFVLLGGLFRRR